MGKRISASLSLRETDWAGLGYDPERPSFRRRPEGAADRNGETPMDDPALVEALQAGDPQAPAPVDRAIPGGDLRPVLPHDEPPPGCGGRRPGDVPPRPASDRRVRRRLGRSVPGSWRSRRIVAVPPSRVGPDDRPSRRRSRSRIGPTPGQDSPTPTTWPESSTAASASSGPNIAWSLSCFTSRISPTTRSPRRSHGRSVPSRPGCIAPGPNSPRA